jgi:hypothetical protein
VKTAFLLLLLFAVTGCTSSKLTPRPFTWDSDTSPGQAREALRKAEAKQPCSEQNLKHATDEQKRKCDPTRDMFENVRPKKQDQQAHKRKSTNR